MNLVFNASQMEQPVRCREADAQKQHCLSMITKAVCAPGLLLKLPPPGTIALSLSDRASEAALGVLGLERR